MLNEEDLQKVLKHCGLILQVKKHEPIQRDLSLKNMIFSILKNSDNLISKQDL